MTVRGVEDIQAVSEQATLLRIATLVARDEPHEQLFAAAGREAAQLLSVATGAVLRLVGAERAVVVGVWHTGDFRALPVNAELDFDPTNSAVGKALSTLRPARVTGYHGGRGELPVVMKAIGLRASVAAPVLRGGAAWGALVASATEDEALPAGCELRLAGIAGLLGQALDNAVARAELADSRRRLVAASDETRRRLERALHEGAHQHVVALALKLRVAAARAAGAADAELAAIVQDALADAMEASAELSELARGLHPAVLSERGLAAALQALAARAAVPVHMRELPGRRYPEIVETGAYRFAAEALDNVAAHAHATECSLLAADRGDRLVVEVSDNGIGGARARRGGGLECLADRADAIGARFELSSARGEGTSVRVEIPVER
ncbi:MAG TPA: GAF domain-containing protein [Solirubrobacter sp.]|nr:GAF domain-containing protein [Solirubrobacter sp.]